jgi:hypothetical protein
MQRRKERACGRSYVLHRAVECGSVGLRRRVEAGQLAHELQGRGVDFVLGCRGLEIEQRTDIAAHDLEVLCTGALHDLSDKGVMGHLGCKASSDGCRRASHHESVAPNKEAMQTGHMWGKRVVRAIALIGLAFALAACATTAPEAGDWKIERGQDRILGKPAAYAHVAARSRNDLAQANPHLIAAASLQLGCFDNSPTVRIEFNHRIGTNRTSVLNYRFDENPGRETSARFLQTYKTAVIENKDDVARFVNELRTASKLYVRVMSHLAGTSSVEFPVQGGAMAADAAYANCPLPPAPVSGARLTLTQGSHLFARNESRPRFVTVSEP